MSFHTPEGGVGSYEVFYMTGEDLIGFESDFEKGWYWWACFPGCLPDGDPHGPFATEKDAIDNALNGD